MAEIPTFSSTLSAAGLSMPLISRRAALAGLGGGALALAAGKPARADIMGLVVVGGDGWLYPIWDEVRRFDAARFKVATQVINDAVAIMKKAGIETVISLTPSKSRIYREYLPKDFAWNPDADKRYAMALDVLRKPGTLVPDLATTFMEARKANPAEQYFFKTDTHWTPVGAELAAVAISKEVLAKIKLPPSAKPGTQLGDYMEMIQSKNDLSDQLPASEKPKYPKERYRIRKEGSGNGEAAGLLEDDSADTVLIGNSYTQPKYGFASELSKGLNRPVGLTWRVHQFGSYDILLEYFKTAAFKQGRPKLIIWDFEETDMEGTPDRKDFWGEHAMTSEQFLGEVRKAVGA
jgi:alginate O-acetyltransferase complex protein AlgJ